MPRYKIIIEYDGTPFAGWQCQDNAPSVQRALWTAIEAFSGEKATVQGAGRTDAGVHALGQVAHFDLGKEHDHRHRARRDQRASAAASGRDALGGSRAGGFQRAPLRGAPPLSLSHRQPAARSRARPRLRAWRVPRPLDVDGDARGGTAARRQARLHHVPLDRMPGQVAGQDARPARCPRSGDEIHIIAVARSFLHNQVRSMVGSLVPVGDGKWSADDLAARAGGARPRGLRPGRAAGGALSGAGGLLNDAASLLLLIDQQCLELADPLHVSRFFPLSMIGAALGKAIERV